MRRGILFFTLIAACFAGCKSDVEKRQKLDEFMLSITSKAYIFKGLTVTKTVKSKEVRTDGKTWLAYFTDKVFPNVPDDVERDLRLILDNKDKFVGSEFKLGAAAWRYTRNSEKFPLEKNGMIEWKRADGGSLFRPDYLQNETYFSFFGPFGTGTVAKDAELEDYEKPLIRFFQKKKLEVTAEDNKQEKLKLNYYIEGIVAFSLSFEQKKE